MKGLTFYVDDIKRGMDKMTDEQLGFVFRTFMESLESNTVPTFEDDLLDALSYGFKLDMDKGLTRHNNGKYGGAPKGNQNARKYIKSDDEPSDDDVIDMTKVDDLVKFLTENPSYVENNRSFSEAKLHNGKLNDFCGQSGITIGTGEYVFSKLKSKQ